MVEITYIVDKHRITYEGLFSAKELYAIMDEWFEEKGYDKVETKNNETVKADGKFIEIVYEPYKKITDYAKSVFKIRLIMSNIKEVDVVRDGVKVRMNHGKVQFVIDAMMLSDWENKWETTPVFFFIRTILDKYLLKPYTVRDQNEVKDDYTQFVAAVKGYLNLQRFQ